MEEKRIVVDTFHHNIIITENNGVITIIHSYKPLINEHDKGTREIIKLMNNKVLVRNSDYDWDGMQPNEYTITLTPSEFENLRNAALKIHNITDFNNLLQMIIDINDRKEKELERILDKLTDKLEELAENTEFIEKVKELIENQSTLIYLIKECL